MFDQVKEIGDYLTELFPAWRTFISNGILLAALLGILAYLVRGVLKVLNFLTQRQDKQWAITNLLPNYDDADVKYRIESYVPSRFQNEDPAEVVERSVTRIKSRKYTTLLIPHLTKALNQRSITERVLLILGDSGMGKTTFLINFYVQYRTQRNRLIGRASNDISIYPLASRDLFTKIESIPDKANHILLLDALDEDPSAYEDYNKRLKEIFDHTLDFRFVIITCRTHFFPNDRTFPTSTGLWYFSDRPDQPVGHIYLSPFDWKDVIHRLLKVYIHPGRFSPKRMLRAYRLIRKINLISMRPLILSFVDRLIDDTPPPKNVAEVYDRVIKDWIKRESEKASTRLNHSPIEFEQELGAFCSDLANTLFNNADDNPSLTYDPATKKLSGGVGLMESMIAAYPDGSAGWSRSMPLINRTGAGHYKFAHRSILEFIVARAAYERGELLSPKGFTQIPVFALSLLATDTGKTLNTRHLSGTDEIVLTKNADGNWGNSMINIRPGDPLAVQLKSRSSSELIKHMNGLALAGQKRYRLNVLVPNAINSVLAHSVLVQFMMAELYKTFAEHGEYIRCAMEEIDAMGQGLDVHERLASFLRSLAPLSSKLPIEALLRRYCAGLRLAQQFSYTNAEILRHVRPIDRHAFEPSSLLLVLLQRIETVERILRHRNAQDSINYARLMRWLREFETVVEKLDEIQPNFIMNLNSKDVVVDDAGVHHGPIGSAVQH